MRLINEDDVLRIVERVTNEAVEKNQRKYLIQPRIIAEIAGLPTVEAEPVKHGRWVNGHCTHCGEDVASKLDTWTDVQNFICCPNCGAKMDGESE